MAGEKFGYFRLFEETEGEDGSLSSGSSWLEVLCEWRGRLTTGCFSFVCKKSLKVFSCYEVVGGGEGGQRTCALNRTSYIKNKQSIPAHI